MITKNKALKALSIPIYIEVEIGTYCNRRCRWCPNSTSNRGRQAARISQKVWLSILKNLQEANYQGQFAFHNYNEPLADPLILEYLESARFFLPDASLIVYTNGDYLNPDLLRHLEVTGLSELRVTLYPGSYEESSSGNERIARYSRRLGLQTSYIADYNKFSGAAVQRVEYGSLSIVIRVPEFKLFNNRAGVLSSPPAARTIPCYLPLQAAAVDVHGNLKLCCHIYDSLKPDVTSGIIGNVTRIPLLRLWGSYRMNRRRRQLADADFSELPFCRNCNYTLSTSLADFLAKL
jgi:hypothetical protein